MQKQLIIMPFDHRGSFKRGIIGAEEITKRQHQELEKLKQFIYQAFLKVYKRYVQKDNLAILVDEEFGSPILRDAKKRGIQICLTTEKSGQYEFDFEYDDNFREHIDKFKPDYVKALVRYNPLKIQINKKQLEKLKKLSDFCEKNNYKLLLELLVPPTEKDLHISRSESRYEKTLKVKRTIGAVNEIQKKVKVHIWKMEGFSVKNWKKIIKVVPKDSSVIVLGRGENEKKVKKWLSSAAKFDQVIGFAVGRTIFLNALKRYYLKKISKRQAINIMSRKFQYFINIWKKNKK